METWRPRGGAVSQPAGLRGSPCCARDLALQTEDSMVFLKHCHQSAHLIRIYKNILPGIISGSHRRWQIALLGAPGRAPTLRASPKSGGQWASLENDGAVLGPADCPGFPSFFAHLAWLSGISSHACVHAAVIRTALDLAASPLALTMTTDHSLSGRFCHFDNNRQVEPDGM